MLRILVSRSIMAVAAVVVAGLFVLLVLYCSGNESLAQGSHSHAAHAAKFKPLKMCEYNGAKGPCGCPHEVNTEGDFVEGVDKHDVTVTTSTHYIHPGTAYTWKVKHLVICAAYEAYITYEPGFKDHLVRVKTGLKSGEFVAQHEMADLVLWMRSKR